VLEHQGYDLWLEKVRHPTYLPPDDGLNNSARLSLLEKLKTWVEVDLCKETKSVLSLEPSSIRLLYKMEGYRVESTSLHQFSSDLFHTNYPSLGDAFSNLDLRYNWALIKVFNSYIAKAVPYINCQEAITDIPPQAIPMTISAYMSQTRNLCLMSVKVELRHLILEKTSVNREATPKLYFERLKIAHRGEEEKRPQEQTKEKKNLEFEFFQAYEQVKEMDLALLRPRKPQGTAPHLSFMVVFRGEHVVGEGGPYRQFFADISSELQPMLQ